MNNNDDLITEIDNFLSEEQPPIIESSWWSVSEAMTISSAVLVFGLIVILAVAYLIRKGHDPDAILRTFGMTLLIIMSVFLIVAGYSQEQINPVMGLLGTVAGYLLGKDAKPPLQKENK